MEKIYALPSDNVLVPLQVKERELAEFFSEFGSVAYCQVVKDHKKGWSRG